MIKHLGKCLVLLGLCFSCGDDKSVEEIPVVVEPEIKIDSSKFFFGHNLDSFEVVEDEIKYGETLGKILNDHGVNHTKVHYLAKASEDVFDVRDFKVGKQYMVLKSLDSNATALKFVYKANAVDYYFYNFEDSIFVEQFSKPVTIKRQFASGVIKSSLSQTMDEAGLSQRLVMAFADEIYPWTINFFSVQSGDKFKVIYDAKYVDGEFIGIGKVHAANFNHFDNDYYAFSFDGAGYDDYFDEEGNNLRNAFLKAPVQFTRISSKYQPRRRHPVTGRVKAHKGTDFAAPKNTPIFSTADGIVTHAQYKKFNGNYVKIRHNATYTTQYLHMNKIAKGMKPGKKVKQGEVIGYVGKTGLATGYHVCYRFWVNGKQKDPFKVKLPPSKPVADKYRSAFNLVMEDYKKVLDGYNFETSKVDLEIKE